ncbi:hypothetical protein BS47DRAFT_1348450 [Hydnum rufescens UP504]|uniref:Inhibitor I9 domain-containing protein n=1 Tax=Hydnum rufescens UP504 TaxID=1448309 RepID=A0A9P6AQ72_9AGAM|nr:hypothetical protein BS47DRAFT_1348450 [Hydnum rufescens UP504]
MSEAAGNFIVTYKDHVSQAEIDEHCRQIEASGGKINNRYTIIKGFSATLQPAHVSGFAGDPLVDTVEPDGIVHTQ